MIYLLVPLGVASLATLWFREVQRLEEIGELLSGAEDATAALWGKEYRRAVDLVRSIQLGVVGACLVTGLLVLREVRGIDEGDPTTTYGVWMIVVFILAWVIVTALAAWVVFARGRTYAK